LLEVVRTGVVAMRRGAKSPGLDAKTAVAPGAVDDVDPAFHSA